MWKIRYSFQSSKSNSSDRRRLRIHRRKYSEVWTGKNWGKTTRWRCCRWCKQLSGGASAALRRKPELMTSSEDALNASPQCTLSTPCHYSERTPIAHVREKVTTWSGGQPLYSEFFELRPKSTLPPPAPPLTLSSPLHHRCRLDSTTSTDQPPSPSAARGLLHAQTQADGTYSNLLLLRPT